MTRLAVIADLHANLEATLAVHADIQRRGIPDIWVLGDLVGKGPRPQEVVDWVQAHAGRVIQGNWDARVAGASHRPQDLWPRSRLRPADLKYLETLPFGIEEGFGGLCWRFVHASSRGVFHKLYPHSSLSEQLDNFAPQPAQGLMSYADALVFGDIHETLLLDVEGRPLLNCGSVGNPLDSVLPSYLILDFSAPGYAATFVRVPYDRAAEVRAAEESGMPFAREYVAELMTGAYQKRKAKNLDED
ncbi:metallophosphoesterase [Deinococcus proteolyticus MRP]|uniref:Metallophosphoesterase n=1 Tax=Deinococcus proteolyticus (strain ATCC 35074 / DSM 20540 / JCM 6276 / NBRC 101906 / NCIMB 13154 / VKM Ac-1939 / CCM 2703 / MRP) TaxID=693977 RepID=F0RLX3_DEIPM|nr:MULTISPECIES: metallophosphoesterase family protein [Deinococcus]ADY26983.1 metallophosphoesterase [Deinococcus proteolyticus MRP]MCY1703111.1 metallophosphoesterase family protein [Deinococcus sp. SL84]